MADSRGLWRIGILWQREPKSARSFRIHDV